MTHKNAAADRNGSSAAMRLFYEKDFTGAHAKLIQASFTSPTDPNIFVGLALTLEKLDRFEDAAKQWVQVIQFAPNRYTDANQLRHAACLVAVGDFDVARTTIKALNPLLDDQGEKWELIEKIRAAETSEDIHPQRGGDRVKQMQVNMGLSATEIVAGNKKIFDNYQKIITNTGQSTGQLNFQSIVIVTYGRTGSTLLQGMLNTIDGVVMLGENENAFFQLFSYLNTIKRLAARKLTDMPSSPFYGAAQLNVEAAKQQVRATIDNYFAPFKSDPYVQVVGFKEVKFKDNPEDLVAYLEFLEQMFPKPLFIFLWRDHDEVLNSGWWKYEDRVRATAILELLEGKSLSFSEHRKDCFTLTYADLKPDAPKLRDLFAFFGANFNKEKISKILQIPHSYGPTTEVVRDLFQRSK